MAIRTGTILCSCPVQPRSDLESRQLAVIRKVRSILQHVHGSLVNPPIPRREGEVAFGFVFVFVVGGVPFGGLVVWLAWIAFCGTKGRERKKERNKQTRRSLARWL